MTESLTDYLTQFEQFQQARRQALNPLAGIAQQQCIQFPSGSVLQALGGKIVGRADASYSPSDKGSMTAVTVTVGGGGVATSTADRLQGALGNLAKKCEPKRAPLDWNTTTKHDTFGPDFIVTKGAEPTAPLYDSPTTDSAYPAIAGLLRG